MSSFWKNHDQTNSVFCSDKDLPATPGWRWADFVEQFFVSMWHGGYGDRVWIRTTSTDEFPDTWSWDNEDWMYEC